MNVHAAVLPLNKARFCSRWAVCFNITECSHTWNKNCVPRHCSASSFLHSEVLLLEIMIEIRFYKIRKQIWSVDAKMSPGTLLHSYSLLKGKSSNSNYSNQINERGSADFCACFTLLLPLKDLEIEYYTKCWKSAWLPENENSCSQLAAHTYNNANLCYTHITLNSHWHPSLKCWLNIEEMNHTVHVWERKYNLIYMSRITLMIWNWWEWWEIRKLEWRLIGTKTIIHMAAETPEAQSSSPLYPQIQPLRTARATAGGMWNFIEHSFALESYGTSSVALGDSAYFRWSYDLKICTWTLLCYIIKVSEQLCGEEWEWQHCKERKEWWMNWSYWHALEEAGWKMKAVLMHLEWSNDINNCFCRSTITFPNAHSPPQLSPSTV